MTIPFHSSPAQAPEGLSTAKQSAALCWRMRNAAVQVLLISSRDTGRWVIPKGWPIDGLGPAAVAAREAWEEAGVEGSVCEAELGAFFYDKQLKTSSLACSVSVFALRVRKLADRYPEHKQRQRKWVAPDAAALLVQEPGLQALFCEIAENPGLIAGTDPVAP